MEKIYIGLIDCARGGPEPDPDTAWLDEGESQRLERLRLPAARRAFVEGRRLSRLMLAALSGRSPESLRFAIGPDGKPQLAEAGGWHFNISHSGRLVACACARVNLGLDAEWHRPGRDRREVAERFFGPAEAGAVQASQGCSLFYRYWTLKEAWLKWQGVGLRGLSAMPEFLMAPPEGSHAAPELIRRRDGQAGEEQIAVWDIMAPLPGAEAPAFEELTLSLAAAGPWSAEWFAGVPLPPGWRIGLAASSEGWE